MRNRNFLNLRYEMRALPLGALVMLLCSCASTSLKSTWKSPDGQRPSGKIAVLAVEQRGLVREGLENRGVAQLRNLGAPALVTFDLLSLPEIKEDKQAAAERFHAQGAGAILIFRLADTASSFREIQPGGERYAAMVTGFEAMSWYDYYSVGFMSVSPTYGSLKQKVYVEAGLYDLKTEKCLWSGITQTVVKENTDRVAEMDPLVNKIIAALHKDGMVP